MATKKILIAGACAVAVAACVYVLLPGGSRPRPSSDASPIPWVCESCGHTFSAPTAYGRLKCPQCGKRAAVQSVIYVCGNCGAEFEAYRLLDNYGGDEHDESGKPMLHMPYFKGQNGKWTPYLNEVGPTKCPQCGNDRRADRKPKSPGSSSSP